MIYLILTLGLILRLISLNQSFWLDEATSANVAVMAVKDILSTFSPGDFHPPLYYLILHFWASLFGSGEVSLRILSVAAGVGTVYATYLIGKELIGRKAGIIASILLATSGLHIYYSQEARMYALATLFVSLGFLFFVKTLKKGRVGECLAFSVFLTLSAFTDYLPILIIPVLWIFAWRQKLSPNWWKKFSASHIILIGTSFLWLPYFLKQLTAGLSVRSHSPAWWQILGTINLKQLILIPTKFIFGRINMEANLLQVLIVGLIFLFFGFLLFKSLDSLKKTKVVWYWFGTPLVLAILISFWIPTLSYFRLLFVLPAFYLLVGTGVSNLPKKLYTPTIVILALFNLATASIYLLDSKNHREDWRGLTRFVKEESTGKKSVVIFPADSQKEAYLYYDKDAKIATPEEITTGNEEVWLVRYVYEIADPKDETRVKIEELGYQKVQEYNFSGVVVWKYEK